MKHTPARQALTAASAVAGVLVAVLPVLWTLDPGRSLSIRFVGEQFLSLLLACAVVFVLLEAARRARPVAAAALVVGSLVAAAAGAWLVVHFGSDAALFVRPTPAILAVSLAVMLTVTIALGLSSGSAMVVLVVATLSTGYLAQYFGAPFDAAPVSAARYVTYMVVGGDAFLGQALAVIGGTVTVFILFGAMFEASGGAAALDVLALRLARGGSGVAIKATIISSALFGTVSGSATSNVLTSGSVTIGGMRRMGVPAPQAGGIEALSSTLGQLTPPVMGAAAFLMADISGIPYGTIALSAAIPAAICYVIMLLHAGRYGRRIEAGRALDPSGLPPAPPLRWSMLWHLAPFAAITVTMTAGDRATAMAGVMGAATAAGVGILLAGPSGFAERLLAVGPRTARAMAVLVLAGSGLGVVVGALNLTGLDVSLALGLIHVGEKSLLVSLVLTALAALVLGAGLSTSGVYIVVATLLVPGLVKLGVEPIAAHMFVLYFGVVSMITPPVAFAALAASGISGAKFSETAFAAMRFGWFLYVLPFLLVFFPGLLLAAPLAETIVTLSTATAVLAIAWWLLTRKPLARPAVVHGAGAAPD
ncbi:TRAP transporter large permease subunit [Aquibium sp. ELW1220]|uniref:TRAP transporter permease n=1 Tax=Aquibium sp. ELW1220 TaxID=2976766 RepID=UPI0025AF0F67|nr:TRAP transporter large permease subunit [Aquibium sp. ELW1220]MDN2581215.1 TRAP transporter large permease subunit [Aquibium sp. ELW1220]